MNVLFLSELFYPHGGGAELATYLYAKLLLKHDVNVKVVTNRFPGEIEKSLHENMEIYRLALFKNATGIKYSLLRRIDMLFSRFMGRMIDWADIVYIARFWYSLIPLAKAHKKPVVLHLHDYIPLCPLAVLYNLPKNEICCNHNNLVCSPKCILTYERSFAKSLKQALPSVLINSLIGNRTRKLVELADAIICVSEAQKRLIDARAPLLGRRSYVIYNPLPEPPSRDVVRNDLGYFGGANVLKGFHVLLRALKCVNEGICIASAKVHATRFNRLSPRLVAFLSRFGIIPYGRLSRDDYCRIYRKIRTVVVPSIWPETWGYVATEAILSKRLVVASRVGGLPEQLSGLEGAFLFEPRNTEQLARHIQYIQGLPNEVKEDLGSRNKETFLDKFSNEKTSQRFLELLIQETQQQ